MLTVAGFILPPMAVDTHFLLSQELGRLTLDPLIGWQMVLFDSRVQKFYLLYAAITALLLIWALVSCNYIKYRSDMQRVTPDIETPCAAGQGQFGTARWMQPENIGRHFAVWKVPQRQKWFKQMINSGRLTHKEVEDSNVHID